MQVSTTSSSATHLVVVCGHGTYRRSGDVWQESSWILQSFQRSNAETSKPSEHLTFIQHILCGASILDQDPKALLVFSGGCTQDQIPSTEAESYSQAFSELRNGKAQERTSCENLATDSYQNLLFSVLQFRKVTGQYPQLITVITHAFKERRFLESHGPAIRWPPRTIRTIGINPALTLAELKQVQHGEHENAFKHFVTDPYGVKPHLGDKRRKRGFQEEDVLEYARHFNDDVKSLLLWKGG
ncbi:hypothetical protein AMS68_001293 [Peltaster fructicola]|uniref:DUF218 domain-containing protein n=1 Tax=Peltaster fructicola TaxID=286661 RepID=A0A6H0XM42_9PEZI|nr:hypothetical protein AMS68_001293 [Peltaster fructicola]